jgi:hypothetical protein
MDGMSTVFLRRNFWFALLVNRFASVRCNVCVAPVFLFSENDRTARRQHRACTHTQV